MARVPLSVLISFRFLVTFLVAPLQNGLAVLYALRLRSRFDPVAALDATIVVRKAPFRAITSLVYYTIILVVRVHGWCLGCECIASKATKHHSNSDEHYFYTDFHVSLSVDAYSFAAFAKSFFIRSNFLPEREAVNSGMYLTSALGQQRGSNPSALLSSWHLSKRRYIQASDSAIVTGFTRSASSIRRCRWSTKQVSLAWFLRQSNPPSWTSLW